MKLWWQFREWRRRRRHPPAVMISQYAQKTERPRVSVGIASATGSMNVFDYPDNTVGNAQASLSARSLADIAQLPLYDQRAVVDEAERAYVRAQSLSHGR
jgi:hypothetical protein